MLFRSELDELGVLHARAGETEFAYRPDVAVVVLDMQPVHSQRRPEDCVDISTDNDSLYCYPTKRNVVTKLSFATEEIYKMKRAERKRAARDQTR